MTFLQDTRDRKSRQEALAHIGADLTALAAGLDRYFVSAGTALSTSYTTVERLVGALEGVSGAINRKASAAAVETMQQTAARLTQLPDEQAKRQHNLGAITAASADLLQNLNQIRRTLSFLHICGLNIKVTAAGAENFASFADHMFAKLRQAEQQVDEFEAEITHLRDNIAEMVKADRLLIAECTSVIPRVPIKLSQDAQSLQQLQEHSAELAEHTAALARDVRTKVATAIGALQIGDITRQRLEHIAEAIALLDGELQLGEGDPDSLAGEALDPVIALLAAQTADTQKDFLRETAVLFASLHGIAPDAVRLADMQQESSSGDSQQLLHRLEEDVAEMAHVTQQLCEAEANSGKLGQATAEAADSLRGRLHAVNRIQRDVQQMAWNTALQCRHLGSDGRGIAVISEEIQSFSRHLADIWELVAENFTAVEQYASSVGAADIPQEEQETADMLVQSLDTIREGNDRMAQSRAMVDQDALQIAQTLRALTDDGACEAELSPAIASASTALTALALGGEDEAEQQRVADDAEGAAAEIPLQALTPVAENNARIFARIAALYTMAQERDVHRSFVMGRPDIAQDAAIGTAAADISGDDGLFDDGLFGDGLFDDGSLDDGLFTDVTAIAGTSKPGPANGELSDEDLFEDALF